ncbi:MAG: periplasmic heavy metal sensor [Candidatus Riflebacteria bacterium]|nr:periplasmic heavy metal sensor [Candidatus Riflebacteria bacterium]
MWRKIAPLLIVLSVTLNVAFVGCQTVHFFHAKWASGGAYGQGAVGCPLHRQLGTDREQWRRIEPVVTAFRTRAQAVCRDVTRARGELLELLAAPQLDRRMLAAKQDEILAGQRRMQGLVIEHLLAEKRLLTPQQSKELFELLRRRSNRADQGQMLGLQPGGLEDAGAGSGPVPERPPSP